MSYIDKSIEYPLNMILNCVSKTNKHLRHKQTNKNSTIEIYLKKKWVTDHRTKHNESSTWRLTCHCTAPNFTLNMYHTSACYFNLYSKYTLMKKTHELDSVLTQAM